MRRLRKRDGVFAFIIIVVATGVFQERSLELIMKKWRIAGINFDHMHMGDNLRMAFEHPNAELVGICDENPQRMENAIRKFALPPERVFNDYRACMEKTKPDLVLLCPATAQHGQL